MDSLPADGVLTLTDGRRLGWIEIGDPHDPPVFLLHGAPGSRFDALLAEPEALAVAPPARRRRCAGAVLEARGAGGRKC